MKIKEVTVQADSLYHKDKHPKLIVISGPSGVGKDTIARSLIDTDPDRYYFVVTATTRPPRDGEVHGVDYFFFSNDEFAEMIENNELLEYAVVYNDYKGIPKQQIRDALGSGRDVIMRVDVQGAATIRKIIPNAISVFLTTETEEELVRRLIERKSETAEGLKLRIAAARQEMKRLQEFDYWVVNAEGRQERAVREILSIIEAAHCLVNQEPIRL
ncbi:MAG: guanylate kinase [Ardenticatenaceae bacterium]|nr:guanylate kinase [Anaerolineales bacterium]MCB8940678.1 guanylate kinase [Ardenticatenaceae bacterium]MCB8972008.1 guanylate kinase [Ardenticatenaceae bacterium]